jgi:Protein of unknown function (DUF3152)
VLRTRRSRSPRTLALVVITLVVGALAVSACLPLAPVTRVVTYSVSVDGSVQSDVNLLAQVAADAYNSPRGWRAAGIRFERVASGGDFTLVLAEASHLPNYDPVCSVDYSCQVGRYVVINDDRFRLGSSNWPGPLEWYRTMVVNHETGHWLGLGHSYCPEPGHLAPIMQQQSISMQGCAINSWPLGGEIQSVAG